MPVLFIALGGAVGAVLRYASVIAVARVTGTALPWGTLAVNVAGSFVLGFLMLATERLQLSDGFRQFAAVGLIGAFTTFSAFTWEITWLLRQGEWARAGAYAVGSVLVGVVALIAGGVAASAVVPAAHG